MVTGTPKRAHAKARPARAAGRGLPRRGPASASKGKSVYFSAVEAALLELPPALDKTLRKVIIEHNMQTGEPPLSAVLDQARRNAAARDAFIAKCGGLLTSAQVAELAGSSARNAAQLAWRLRQEGRIFAVEHRGQTYLPALQFDPNTGKPRGLIRDLIAELAPLYSGWSLALWFDAPNDWLDGRSPFELLASRPQDVVAAAHAEVATLDD